MNTIKNTSFFNTMNEVPMQYPWLSFDETCDVLVIGGGVTGCATAYRLAESEIDTILISGRPIGYCETSIDSSTLNYQNEVELTRLSATIGREKALQFFAACENALDEVEQLATKLSNFDFCRRDSFLYTDNIEHVNELHAEYLMRKHNGYQVEFIEKSDARELFSFNVQAGILSKNSGGELDCYKFCHALVQGAEKSNARIYENTTACELTNTENGVIVVTDNRKVILAKKVVCAIGYQQDIYLNCLSGKKRSFFVATSPISSFSGFESRALVKNKSKNINLRTTKDDRIIISGLDSSSIDKDGRIGKIIGINRLITRKNNELENVLKRMLCGVSPLDIEYQYSGIYGTTKDSMPIIGEVRGNPNTYFSMPSSINGTLHSVIGAKIITNTYLGNDVTDLFSPNRSSVN